MFYIQNKHNSQVFLAVKVPPVEVAVGAAKRIQRCQRKHLVWK